MDALNTPPLTHTQYASVRQHNFQQATLLVVEDQDDIWTLIHFGLAKYFPDVTLLRCANRKETVAYLADCLANQTVLPKLILQDLYLPQNAMGFSLLKDIRMILGSQQQLPILVMSASVAEADIARPISKGPALHRQAPDHQQLAESGSELA